MRAKRFALMLLLVAGWAHAQGLPDPTRPPAIVVGGTGDIAGAQPEPASGGLQSIIRHENGKAAAVINGRYVELGGKLGDATLTRINEDSVELRSASGRETMYLTPGIGKKKVKP